MHGRFFRVCVLFFITQVLSGACLAAEVNAKKTHYIIGGSAIGIRSETKQEAESAFNVDIADVFKSAGANQSITIVVYPNSEALLSAFDREEVDGYFGSPIEYLARKDKLCKRMAAVQYKYAPLKQTFLVIVRTDDGISQIKDFKNSRLTLGSYQDTEEVYLNTLLLRNHLPEIPQFFIERQEAKNANRALMDVFFKKSDMTIVRENDFKTAVELNPQLGKKLMILQKSLPYFSMLAVLRNKVSEEDFSELITTFIRISSGDKSRKVLDMLQLDSVNPVSADDLQDVQNLVNEYESLKKLNANLSLNAAPAVKAKIKQYAH